MGEGGGKPFDSVNLIFCRSLSLLAPFKCKTACYIWRDPETCFAPHVSAKKYPAVARFSYDMFKHFCSVYGV